MVRLTTCADGMEARILAARLGAEGILWSIQGSYEGPLSIGAVELLVAADDLDDARALLEADVELEAEDVVARPPAAAPGALVVVLVVAAVILFALLRMGARV